MENYHQARNIQELRMLERNLTFIYELADYVNRTFVGKETVIETAKERLTVSIQRNNLQHLLGINYLGGNQQFWNDVEQHKLSPIAMQVQNYTSEKLRAMRAFRQIFEGNALLVNGMILQRIALDKALRTNKLILALGLDRRADEEAYFIRTAISLRSFHQVLKGDAVLAIYTIDLITGEKRYLHD